MWERTTKADPIAVALANRHYSRVKYGKQGKMVGPPGRLLTLITPCKRAVWVTHWPYMDLALDRLDAWRCTMFRNEGAGLSSDLIRAAMAETERYWDEVPRHGWITWIDAGEVESANPGYCFKQAGWRLDKEWKSTRKDSQLIRMRADGPDGTHTQYADAIEYVDVVRQYVENGQTYYVRETRKA